MSSYRRDPAYLAFIAHRISGIALAVFLPLHFLALGLVLEGAAELDTFLRWSEHPLVVLSELVLVFLLMVHLAGGVRLLIIEFVGWTARQQALITLSFALGLAASLAFAINMMA